MNDQITAAINFVSTLAPAEFTVFAVILFGYIVRGIKVIKNDWIPLFNLIIGTGVYLALMWDRNQPEAAERISFVVRHAFVGLAIGFAAWGLHEKYLSQWEDKIPGLNAWINRGNVPEVKPPTQPPTP